jgi:uncharacterized protein
MPIMSAMRKEAPRTSVSSPSSCQCGSGKGAGCCCGGGFGKKIVVTLLAIILAYGIFYLGTLISNNIKKYQFIGLTDKSERMITINGMGKVNGQNNIAVTSIGYSNTDKDVGTAQVENKKVMDQVFSDLKKMGIEDKDLQSNYTIYPDYNYTSDRGQELKGYRVSNTVTVKIRDLAKINEVLGLAGKFGATEVGGLSFTIDDPSNLKDEARGKALADAKKKAYLLAQSLGVTLGEVVSYNEYDASNDAYYPKYSVAAEGGGMGGGAPEAVAGGSKDVVMNVSVTYELIR